MADAAKEQEKSKAGKKRSRKGRGLIGFALIILIVWKMPYAFVLLLGMSPGGLSWLLDRDRAKLTATTVCALNFAALMPFLVSLWERGGAMAQAVEIMTHPLNWIVIILGVMFGWIFAQALPALVVSTIMIRERSQVKRMRENQQRLVEEWGSDVSEKADQSRPSSLL